MTLDDTPTPVRLTPELRRRLKALAPRLSRLDAYSAVGTVTFSAAMRLAIQRGIEALEAEVRKVKGG